MSDTTVYQTQLTEAQRRLVLWLAAETALTSGGQSYTIEDGDMRRTLTRADGRLIVETIASLRSEIAKLERKIASPSRSRIMFGHGVGRGF